MQRIVKIFIVLFVSTALFSRCAQIVAPTGGPKDTLPPVLLQATPPDSSLHFKAKEIELVFNEYIQLKDLQKEMIISPNPKKQPEIRARLRSLSIKWNDTLKPNTTYIINMGNAVEDNNEGNPLTNFRYVFSTGDYLDSLEISGKIQDAETGLPDSLMAVMLYPVSDTGHAGDSIVTQEKPLYYTRTKGDGTFLFQNLPHGTFHLFALNDANGDLQYNDTTEAFAFQEQPLKVDSSLRGIDLYAFLEKANKPAAETAPDSGKKPTELKYSVVLNSGRQDLNKPLEITFAAPIKNIDSTKILLQEDTTFHSAPFRFGMDSSAKEASLTYSWKENMTYRLILDSSFATDTSGLTVKKRDTVNFQSKSLSDYGTLTLHFTNIPADTSGQYVIQLFRDKDFLTSSPLKGSIWKQGYLDPGDYQVRVLKDDNRNGQWDRGCYYCADKRQPEKVMPLPNKFTVKANWDNDFTDLTFSFEK